MAKLAGLPDPVLERARTLLKNLERAEYNEFGLPSIASAGEPAGEGPAQMELFGVRRADEEAVLDEIRKAELERMSPLDALLRVSAWKERMTKRSR